MIQQSINQGLSLLGILTTTSRRAGIKAEESAAQKKIQQEREEAETRYKALQKHAEEGIAADKSLLYGEEAELDIQKEVSEIAKQRYLANPTEETYADYRELYDEYRMGQKEATIKARNAARAEQERLESDRIRRKILSGGLD